MSGFRESGEDGRGSEPPDRAGDGDDPGGWVPDDGNDATAGAPSGADGAATDGELDALVRAAFDLLPTQVAVLDGEGTIRHTNRTWRAFGRANGLAAPADTVGVNYLDVCRGSDDEHAARAVAGLEAVLSGEREVFSMEYPCHGPDERRWFVMWARGFERDAERHAVVAHLDVTERKLSELAVERRNEELEKVNRIGELVREIVASLGRATTRAEVERTVCDGLTADGAYAAAAIVDPATEEGIAVRERSVADGVPGPETGSGAPDADGAADESGVSARVAGAVRVALDEGEACVVRAESDGPGAEAADAAVIAAPLRHRDAVYGVLAVTARRPDAFDEREAAAFDVLGESAGFAVHAVETERFLHADDTLELRFRLRDGAVPFFSALARRDGATVAFRDVVPAGAEELVVYATVRGATAADAVELAADDDAVASVRVLADGEGDAPARLEFRYRPPSPIHAAVRAGGAVRSCRVAEGGGSLVVEVDDGAAMRAVVDALDGAADLVGKEGRARAAGDAARGGGSSAGSGDGTADAAVNLTDRQRDALVAAYRGGYYEWPRRESTAEELAAAMGVAPQTFHEHLRRAEAKVLDRFVADGLARRPADPE